MFGNGPKKVIVEDESYNLHIILNFERQFLRTHKVEVGSLRQNIRNVVHRSSKIVRFFSGSQYLYQRVNL